VNLAALQHLVAELSPYAFDTIGQALPEVVAPALVADVNVYFEARDLPRRLLREGRGWNQPEQRKRDGDQRAPSFTC